VDSVCHRYTLLIVRVWMGCFSADIVSTAMLRCCESIGALVMLLCNLVCACSCRFLMCSIFVSFVHPVARCCVVLRDVFLIFFSWITTEFVQAVNVQFPSHFAISFLRCFVCQLKIVDIFALVCFRYIFFYWHWMWRYRNSFFSGWLTFSRVDVFNCYIL